MTLNIIAYGIPGPQGSKVPVGTGTTVDGHAFTRMRESSRKVKPWRKAVEAASRIALLEAGRVRYDPLDGPLVARMVFTLAKPISAPVKRQTWPDRYPDVSKLARSTEDALVTAGVIADDARIVEYERLAKVFPNEDPEALDRPGVRIVIKRLEIVSAVGVLQNASGDLFQPTTVETA